jgi:hypothetical protein
MSVPGTTLENEATGLVMNNLIYNNNTHGLFVAHNTPDVTFEPEARTLAELQDYNLKIIGNTFYMNGLDEVPGAVPFAEGNASIKIRTSSATIFKNNVVYCKQDTLCVDASDHGNQFNELNYNLYFKEPESGPSWKWGSQVFDYEEFSDYQNHADGREGNSLVANPQFVDDAAENFQLRAASPASGQGFAIIDDWGAVGERNGLLPGSDWPNNVIKVNQAKYPGWAIGAFVE